MIRNKNRHVIQKDNLEYESIIIDILLEAGPNGLALHKIARHVHNTVNTLFDMKDYADVYADVRKIIYKNSRNSYSLFKRTSVRGRYKLNKKSEMFIQRQIEFSSDSANSR